MRFVDRHKEYLLLLGIIFFAATVRFYRLPEMASFDFDQEYASNFAYFVLHDGLKLLIGQGLSVQGLFMGPWYFYYLVPFFWLTNLHPIGGTIGSVVLGLITILVYFWVGKRYFGFDYLFKLYGQIPQTEQARPPIYTIVIPKELSPGSIDIIYGNIGVILKEAR